MTLRLLSSRRRKAIAAIMTIALVASTGVVVVADSASPPESGPAVDTHVGHSYIYTVDVANGDLTQETNHLGEGALEPDYSPQGEIAFSTMDCDECSSTIAQVDPDAPTSTEVPVDTNVEHLFQPSWAPDGRRFAAVALGRGLYEVDSQNGTSTRLTSGSSDEAPNWSPAGDVVAFHRQLKGANYEIYTVDVATRKQRRITFDKLQQTNAAWSPDGTRLAFAEQRNNGLWAIVTMNADGSNRKRITSLDISGQEPSWAPDGNSIAFVLQELDEAAIATIPADGGSPTRLTDESVLPSNPSWSPDGDNIAFSALVVTDPPTN